MTNKQWCKKEDGKVTFYNGRIILGDFQIFNPSEEQLIEAGYEEYVPEPYVPSKQDLAQQEIFQLKAELEQEDYKIIKCAEAQLVNAEMPYDIQELVSSRNTKRARINELEASLISE